MRKNYEAVTADELTRKLGQMCSPGYGRSAYVIGPDIHGRICHIASFYSMADAKQYLKKLNDTGRITHDE